PISQSQFPSEPPPQFLQVQTESPSGPQPITAYTTQEIEMLKIPASKAEIEQQELIAYATLPTNDPVPWGLKRLISNIAIAGFRALTEIESKEQCIRNLQSQLEGLKAKKTVNRSRIPTQGQAWIDREDIERFFEAQTTEARQTAERKYLNATKLVCTRKEKLEEYIRKRNDAEKMEEMGNLPKRRKTGAELLQEEGQLGKQIREAEQRVKKIEKHIVELAGNTNVEGEEEIGEDSGSPEPFGGAEVDTIPTPVIADAFVD
ncbi:hypothetical protein HOY80DRAFT_1084809, partial [Tuber brumale]